MLATFQGVVERGQIRWIGIAPPEGARVVVVAPEYPSIEEQEARLAAIPDDEWRKPFEEMIALARHSPPPEVDIDAISDQELIDLVHEVRTEMMQERERASRH
jgi:hypothetical protein